MAIRSWAFLDVWDCFEVLKHKSGAPGGAPLFTTGTAARGGYWLGGWMPLPLRMMTFSAALAALERMVRVP
ncbi:hypothetical protein WA016_02192 [Myxococcus stipitatus]